MVPPLAVVQAANDPGGAVGGQGDDDVCVGWDLIRRQHRAPQPGFAGSGRVLVDEIGRVGAQGPGQLGAGDGGSEESEGGLGGQGLGGGDAVAEPVQAAGDRLPDLRGVGGGVLLRA